MPQIRIISDLNQKQIDELNTLLIDSVNHGASIGFLSPISKQTAAEYWKAVAAKLPFEHVLITAENNGKIIGSVQVSPCLKENGRHRAEVQKLFVLSSERGKGIAALLMNAAVNCAKSKNVSLLVLDTHEGSNAEKIYEHLGWEKAGIIPEYAATPDGKLHGTVLFYKKI